MTMGADECGFLAAIEAAPDDAVPQLIFADYLDERGDPQGPWYRWLGSARPAPLAIEYGWRPARVTLGWCQRRPSEVVLPWMVPGALYRRLSRRYRRRVPVYPGSRRAADVRVFYCFDSAAAAVDGLRRAWEACVAAGGDPLADAAAGDAEGLYAGVCLEDRESHHAPR